MADITADQFKDAARRAYEAGDVATARKLIQRAKSAAPQRSDQSPERGLLQTIGDNVIGFDDGVESPGERLGELIRGGGAAVARGMADVPAIPANLAQLGARGVEKLTGMDEPSAVSRAIDKLPDTRDMLASVPVIGPESRYKAPGTAGEYISTIGEFAGGAGAMAGPGAMLRYGAVPGAASEAAGQATEGTSLEPWARTGAALGASIAAAPKPGKFRGSSEQAKMANKMQDAGVEVTAGQARQSQPLMRMEGRLAPTAGQLDDFTAATMRQIGSTSKKATPTALRAAEGAIVKQMDDAVAGVSITPGQGIARAAGRVATDYAERVPQVALTPRIRGIANELEAFAKNGKPVPLSRLKTWRSDVGKFTVSNDASTREAAHSLRKLIDKMTDDALTAANRADDIPKLAQAREAYRNYIGVRDAASRAGAEAGDLSPTALNQSVIRAQGRENYATGRTTDMADFTRSGAATLRQAPTVNPGGQRTITDALPAALGFGAYGLGNAMGASPVGSIAAGVTGAALPAIGQSVMRSNAAQAMLRDPVTGILQNMPVLPGLLSQN